MTNDAYFVMFLVKNMGEISIWEKNPIYMIIGVLEMGELGLG